MQKTKAWGQSLAVDLHGCDKGILTDPAKLKKFIIELCKKIKMKRHGQVHLDRFGSGDLEGYSAMQFIETSSVTAHLDENHLRAFIDVFSCKPFNVNAARNYAKTYFKAKRNHHQSFVRG